MAFVLEEKAVGLCGVRPNGRGSERESGLMGNRFRCPLGLEGSKMAGMDCKIQEGLWKGQYFLGDKQFLRRFPPVPRKSGPCWGSWKLNSRFWNQALFGSWMAELSGWGKAGRDKCFPFLDPEGWWERVLGVHLEKSLHICFFVLCSWVLQELCRTIYKAAFGRGLPGYMGHQKYRTESTVIFP